MDEQSLTVGDLESILERKLSEVQTSIKALEGRFDNLEKGQRDLKESVRFLEQRVGEGQNLTDKKIEKLQESVWFLEQRVGEGQNLTDKKIEKLQRILNSRIDNIHAARSVPVYPHTPLSVYVAEGKPDTENYVSNDMIEPLPKFYR